MYAECENGDSCRPGQQHWFPDMGVVVRFKQDTTVKVLGESRDLQIGAGTPGVATGDVMEMAHQAAIAVGVNIVWADVEDDIEAVQDRLEPGPSPVGKTIARVEEKSMAGRDTFKDTVTWERTVLTFTDGTSIQFDSWDGEVYDEFEWEHWDQENDCPIRKEEADAVPAVGEAG